ncbi:hypothetical protein HDU93_007095 [Gonapodya sp. JEL0774]|nr:hypothetical protein HDU93_007095 [Gonapodya sp. JEL0774]
MSLQARSQDQHQFGHKRLVSMRDAVDGDTSLPHLARALRFPLSPIASPSPANPSSRSCRVSNRTRSATHHCSKSYADSDTCSDSDAAAELEVEIEVEHISKRRKGSSTPLTRAAAAAMQTRSGRIIRREDESGSESDVENDSGKEDAEKVSEKKVFETPSGKGRHRWVKRTPENTERRVLFLSVSYPFNFPDPYPKQQLSITISIPAQRTTIRQFLRRSFIDAPARPGGMYVSGLPGTGKTAVVGECVKQLEAEGLFVTIDINCATLPNAQSVFARALTDIHAARHRSSSTFSSATLNPKSKDTQRELEAEVCRKDGKPILLLLDEIDHLLPSPSTNHRPSDASAASFTGGDLVHTLFAMPHLKDSRCAVMGIANALDLAERWMPRLRARGVEPALLNFPAYTVAQIAEILRDRVASVSSLDQPLFQPAAVELAARKTAGTGDLRKALDVCRQAIELAEAELRTKPLVDQSATSVPLAESCFKANLQPAPKPHVTLSHVLRASSTSMGTSSSSVDRVRALPLHAKLALVAAIASQHARCTNPSLPPLTVGALYVEYVARFGVLTPCVTRSEFVDLVELAGAGGVFAVGSAAKGKKKGVGEERIVGVEVGEIDVGKGVEGYRSRLATRMAAVKRRDSESQEHEDSGLESDKEGLVSERNESAFKRTIWSSKKRRYGFLCLLTTIVVVVIAVPLALYVIAPKIAQSAIDGSSLTFESVVITNAQNDQFTLRTLGKIKDTGPFSARITFPENITVSYKGKNIAQIPMSPLDASPGSGAVINSTVQARVLDSSAFGSFSQEMVLLPVFDWRLQGSATVEALGRTFSGLSIDKTVTFKGFSGLRNISILSFDLPGNDPNGGIKIILQTLLVNPSTISIAMGDLTFNVSLGGNFIGTTVSTSTTIAAGNNVLNMSGRLAPGVNESQVSQLFTDFVAGKASALTVIGTDVQPPISWLRQSFVGLTLPVTLPAKAANIITGIETKTISLTFDPANPWSPKMTSPQVLADLEMPFAFPLEIRTVRMVISMLSSGAPIASISSGWLPATSHFNGSRGTMAVDLQNANMTISKEQQPAFSAFLNSTLFATGNVPAPISITADSVASTAAGNITISDIKFSTDLQLVGIQGLAASPVNILAFNIIGGTTDYMEMTLTTTIVNPSNIEIVMSSDVILVLLYKGQVVGTVTLPRLTIKIGDNVINATAKFSPISTAAKAAGSQLIAAYIGGIDTTVEIQGSSNSTLITPLVPALSSLALSSTLPGLKSKLLVNSRFMLTDSTVTDFIAKSGFDATNPTSAPLTITHITGQLLRGGTILGSIDTGLNLFIAPGSTARSPALDTKIVLNQASANAIVAALDGELSVDIKVDALTMQVGNYTTTTTYTQNGVVTNLQDPSGGASANKGNLITGLTTGNFLISFDPKNPWAPTMSSSGIVTHLTLPFVFPMTISQVRMNINMNNGIGQITTGWNPATSSFSGKVGTVTTDLTNAVIQIPEAQHNAFAAFMKSTLFATGAAPLPINVLADTNATTPAGNVLRQVNLEGVPFSTNLNLVGMQGLASTPVEILAFDIVGGTSLGMQIKLTTKIQNPSNIRLAQGSDVVFQLSYLGEVVGTVTIPNLTLEIGNNVLSATALLSPQTPAAMAAASKLVGAYIGGTNTTVQITGFSGSTVIPALVPALSALSLSSVLPSIMSKLLLNARFQLTPTTYQDLIAKSGFDAFNPTNVDLTLTHVTSDLIYKGSVIASIDSPLNLAIPAKGSARSPTLDTKIYLVQPAAQAIVDALSGSLNVTIRASALRIKVGDYQIDAAYSQDGVSVSYEDPAGGIPVNKNGIISSVETKNFVLSFDPANPWSPKMSSPGVVSNLHMPFIFPLDIQQVKMTIKMLAAADSTTALATITSGYSPATSRFTGADGVMTTDLTNGAMNVPTATHEAFGALMKAVLFAKGAVPIPVAIIADAQAHTLAGDVTITDIPFATALTLQGMQGLATQPVEILAFDIVGGTTGGMQIRLTNKLFNPSNIRIIHGSDVVFQMVFQNEVVGTVTLPNLDLQMGENVINATALSDSARLAAKVLNSNYIGGQTSTVSIQGFQGSTVLPPLVSAFQSLTLGTMLKGIADKLLVRARIGIPEPGDPFLVSDPGMFYTGFTAYNPTDATMTITHLVSQVIWFDAGAWGVPNPNPNGEVIGTIDTSVTVIIPPKSKKKSPPFGVLVPDSPVAVASLFPLITNALVVTISSPTMSIKIGDYPTEVSYSQPNILVDLFDYNYTTKAEKLFDPTTGDFTLPYPDD